MKFYFR